MTDKVIASDRYSDANTDLACHHCGEMMTRAKTGPPKMYCDKLCKSRAETERDKARRSGVLDPEAQHHKASLDRYMDHIRRSAQRQRRRAAVRI